MNYLLFSCIVVVFPPPFRYYAILRVINFIYCKGSCLITLEVHILSINIYLQISDSLIGRGSYGDSKQGVNN